MNDIQKKLFSLKDEDYKKFHSKLIPSINPELIIGIRTPVLRKFAKDFSKAPEAEAFINHLPHKYYEENNLHAFVLEYITDFDKLITETERFLPYIDNWATCDMFMPKILKKHTDILLEKIQYWLSSDDTYTVRFAIGLLMKLYLDENFKPEYLDWVASLHSEEYYINMMIAWFFATALAKQYTFAITYITEKRLTDFVHNKTIQKAFESNRIPNDTKKYLKQLKR